MVTALGASPTAAASPRADSLPAEDDREDAAATATAEDQAHPEADALVDDEFGVLGREVRMRVAFAVEFELDLLHALVHLRLLLLQLLVALGVTVELEFEVVELALLLFACWSQIRSFRERNRYACSLSADTNMVLPLPDLRQSLGPDLARSVVEDGERHGRHGFECAFLDFGLATGAGCAEHDGNNQDGGLEHVV